MKKDLELLWNRNVEQAKFYLNSRKTNQMIVAALAIESCEVIWGGKSDGLFTYAEFARKIGINPKTLYNWVTIKKNVYDKLNAEEQTNGVYSDFAFVAKKINKSDTSKEVNKIFKLYNKNNPAKKIIRYMHSLKALAYNFRDSETTIKLENKYVEEILFYCDLITKRSYQFYGKLPAINHDICQKENFDKSSGYSPELAKRQPQSKITNSLEDRIIKLKKFGKSFKQITEILNEDGIKISRPSIIKHYNKYLTNNDWRI